MKAIPLIILTAVFFSCNSSVQVKSVTIDSISTGNSSKDTVVAPIAIPADTASTDYLIYLLQNQLSLNYSWTRKLDKLDMFILPLDSMSHLEVNRSWVINDSVSALILQHSDGTSLDEYLLTIKNKKGVIGKIHISDEADADVSEDRPDYYYTKYELTGDRNIKLLKHKLANYDTDKQKDFLSVENWFIQNDGKLLKK